jgi:hypothetical protein
MTCLRYSTTNTRITLLILKQQKSTLVFITKTGHHWNNNLKKTYAISSVALTVMMHCDAQNDRLKF